MSPIKKILTRLLLAVFIFSQLLSSNTVQASVDPISNLETSGQTDTTSPLQAAVHTNEVLVKFKSDGAQKEDLIKTIEVASDSELQKTIKRYKNDSNVDIAQPNYIYKALSVNDTYRQYQWGLDAIEAEPSWNIAPNKGRGIKIAILDTGIDLNHPDLAQNIIGGYNAIDDSSFDDDNGHGTIVAGIAAAVSGNAMGIAGVAGNASLLSVKVLDKDGYGTSESISKGILWAADNGANIINMSLGSQQEDPVIHQAVDYAYSKGCLLVAAAGNDYSPEVSYPAAYDNVIAVSALNEANGLADFSNYGPQIDVAAPGVDIISTAPTHATTLGIRNYGSASGTSMAAPFVSGEAALIKAQYPNMTPSELKQKITGNIYDLGGKGEDIFYGYGAINSLKALGGNSTTLFSKVQGDELEDNNGYDLAPSFNTSTSISGNIFPKADIDWYKLIVPSGSSAELIFSSPSSATNELFILEDSKAGSELIYQALSKGRLEISPSKDERAYYAIVMDSYGSATKEKYMLNYTIEPAVPSIIISGIKDKGIYNQNVAPVISVDYGTYTAKLNDAPFTSGSQISQEGSYSLSVDAKNDLGTEINSTINFIIDKTPPILKVSGVTPGSIYKSAVTPQISVNEGVINASLNGMKFNPGTPVTANGNYKLDITAQDAAGNRANSSICFTIDSAGPKLDPITTHFSPRLSSKVPVGFRSTEAGTAKIKIYDSRLSLVRDIPINIQMINGDNTFYWDGKDMHGRTMYSGTYYASISGVDDAGNVSNTINSTIIFDSTAPSLSLYTRSSSLRLYSGTQVRVRLNESSYTDAAIYDSRGRLVKQLSSNQIAGIGYSYYNWDGRNFSGGYVPRGTYYLKVCARDLAGNSSYRSMKLTVK